jgi:hypothetical protein
VILKPKTNTELATEFPDGAAVISVGDDNSVFANLVASLAEICKLKGVIGYILRSDTSAMIDLTEQDKIIEQFNMAEIESVLVEGKNVKVLCMSIGENRISVFMEKTATHAWIIKRILL